MHIDALKYGSTLVVFRISLIWSNLFIYLSENLRMCCFHFQTNDALVAPLLRLKDNKVHVEEAERSLKKKEKFSELIILYEKKGLHEKGNTIKGLKIGTPSIFVADTLKVNQQVIPQEFEIMPIIGVGLYRTQMEYKANSADPDQTAP